MASNTTMRERRFDLDWIRILAVLLLIPFHSARIFDVAEPFYVKNADLSLPLSLMIGFLSFWQMPLLFLVAGASTWFALGFRSRGQYVGERFKRLLIPFVFGTLLIVPPQMYLALLHRSQVSVSYPEYYPQFFQIRPFDIPDYTGIGFSWAHLWFILNLFVISLVALPLFLAIKRGFGSRAIGWMARLADRRWGIFMMLVPLILVADLPELDGKPVFTHLLLFIFGFVMMSNTRFQTATVRARRPALVLGLVSFSIAAVLWTVAPNPVDSSPEDVASFLARSFNLWCWIVAIMGYGQRYLNVDGRVLRYAREAAYPFYILHQTVIVAIGYYVVQWSAGPEPKFLALAISSLVVTIGLYDLLVRRTNITRLLFGMKPLSPRPSPQVSI